MSGAVPPELDFAMEVSQNKYVSADTRELHAILTVTASRSDREGSDSEVRPSPVAPPAKTAVVIIIDCSGSMAGGNIIAAQRATAKAIDALRNGVRFAVVAGTHEATMVYPAQPELRHATKDTRARAIRSVQRLYANGGTAMGTWLTLARQLLAEQPDALRHAILLTDGHNGEPRQVLDQVLETCRDEFVCDCRGIGAGWNPSELLRIADVLHGTADAVPDESELAADFERMVRATMDKLTTDVRLTITPGWGARLRFLKQVFPFQSELTGDPVARGDASGRDRRGLEHTTGSWGVETRDYHLCLEVSGQDRPQEEDLRAARVDLTVRGAPATPPSPVLVHWTRVELLSAVTDQKVAHYTGQEDVSRAIADGCDAVERHDREAAERHLGIAAKLAGEQGNEAVLERLRRLVQIDDIAAGRVRLLGDIDRSYVLSAMTGTRLSQLAPSDLLPPVVKDPTGAEIPQADHTAPDQICQCGRVSPGVARYCEACGNNLVGGATATVRGVSI